MKQKWSVREVMTKQPRCVSPHDSIKTAAEEMDRHDCGFVPVCQNGKPIGVVTDRDIAIRAVAKGLNTYTAHVDTIMTRHPVTCHEEDSITYVAEMMEKRQIRRLCVVDHNGHIVGVLSFGDIAIKCHQAQLNDGVIRAVSDKKPRSKSKAA